MSRQSLCRSAVIATCGFIARASRSASVRVMAWRKVFEPVGRSPHRVFAQSYFAANEAIASALGDEGQHPGCEPVRLRPLSGLPTQFLAARLGSRDAGADTFRRQLALELSDSGQHGGHHAPVRGRQIERHAIEGDQGHAAGFQLLDVARRSVVLRPQRESSVTNTASISRRRTSANTRLRSVRSNRTPDGVCGAGAAGDRGKLDARNGGGSARIVRPARAGARACRLKVRSPPGSKRFNAAASSF